MFMDRFSDKSCCSQIVAECSAEDRKYRKRLENSETPNPLKINCILPKTLPVADLLICP